MKYICKQLQCKRKVPGTERPEALDSYPRLRDWLRTVNLRPELIEVHLVVLCGERHASLLWSGWLHLSHTCVFTCVLGSLFTSAWGMSDQLPAERLKREYSFIIMVKVYQSKYGFKLFCSWFNNTHYTLRPAHPSLFQLYPMFSVWETCHRSRCLFNTLLF